MRALEERLPGLQAKLHVNGERSGGAAASSGSIVGRVEALEEAMDTLLQVQVGLLLERISRAFARNAWLPVLFAHKLCMGTVVLLFRGFPFHTAVPFAAEPTCACMQEKKLDEHVQPRRCCGCCTVM